MRFLLALLALVTALSFPSALPASEPDHTDESIRIGVLAFRGFEMALNRWKHMADYLSRQIPEHTFTIVPVTNDNIELLVESSKIDFVLTNPASFANLEKKYNIRRLATLINRLNGTTATEFGAVIFTRSDRRDIQNLEDLRGKSFMAVHRNAFGGWWMAKREILLFGLNPQQDFNQIRFSSFPQDQVVFAVLNGEVDAGTVRTSILEHMNHSGTIDLRDFKILNPQNNHYFHQRLSTRLYPEWPFAATKSVSLKLAQDVALALLRMPEDDLAARTAMISGWTAPLDYQSVHDLMQELRVGYYMDYGKINPGDVITAYWPWMAALLLALLLLAISSSYILGRNQRLLVSNQQLEREIGVREELEDRLKYQAMHDTLTDLPNRTLLMDRFRQAIYNNDRMEERLAVAIIDLDQFKRINDTLGHDFGDKVLKQISERFLEVVRKTDTIARFGGDEFVLLIQGFKEEENAIAIVQKLADTLKEPISMGGNDYHIGASIGIALYPDHGENHELLLRHADLAMYKAKHAGNTILMYEHSFSGTK